MFDDTVLSRGQREGLNNSWLGGLIRRYFDELTARGYSLSTLRRYTFQLLRLSDFLQAHGVSDASDIPDWTERFVAAIRPAPKGVKAWRSTVNRFVAFLRLAGIVEMAEVPRSPGPFDDVIAEYVAFLRDHRGICAEAAKNVHGLCTVFAARVSNRGVAGLRSISPALIHEFLTNEGSRYSRKTMSSRCSALRGFLRHLFRRGITQTDLSPAVVAPRLYKHEGCPRFIPKAQIRSVLSIVDRTTRVGRRDYAMILLLATYGLRGIEVIRLVLDDIDWRNNRLRIGGRKAGNTTFYPLTAEVGEAILTYLRNGRPCSSSRRVFLSVKAPFPPLACTAALGIQVRKYFKQVGVQIDRPGTHTFRYSCAQRLLGRAMPLKTIGDFLGHRDPNSTQRYTKIAIEQLREVALSAEEVLR